jgi:hypothetical protein
MARDQLRELVGHAADVARSGAGAPTR